jgi:hypothetical protein
MSGERNAEIERAWRDGWGSALNCLRAVETIVLEHQPALALSDRDAAINRSILDLVAEWADIIDAVEDEVLAKCREQEGGLAP